MITNLALGILTRSAPQLNIFAVGFPITITVGFATLALSLPYLAPMLDHAVNQGLDVMQRIALQMAKH
jgi:flagellar biosynthetic protein FliR